MNSGGLLSACIFTQVNVLAAAGTWDDVKELGGQYQVRVPALQSALFRLLGSSSSSSSSSRETLAADLVWCPLAHMVYSIA
jgi:hypothetical protein